MRLGRRAFLKLIGATVGEAALAAAPIPWIIEDRYVHKELGISFTKPDIWVFVPPKSIEHTADKIMEERGYSEGQNSLMTISKEEWNLDFPSFCPGINVYRYPCIPHTLRNHTEMMLNESKMYEGYQCIGRPTETVISQLPAYSAETEFIFNIDGLKKPTLTRMKKIMIQQDDRLYFIGMYDSPEDNMDESLAFEKFVSGLKIA